MKTTSKNLITFAIDNNYIKYGEVLLRGLSQHTNNADIMCRAVNLSNENVDKLLDIHPTLQVKADNRKMSTARRLFKKLDDPTELYWTYKGRVSTTQGLKNIQRTMYSEQAVYSCHSRFKTIIETYDVYDRILCLDADTIVRRNINHMFDQHKYNSNDLYIVPIREKEMVKLFNNEGLLLINTNKQSKEFFKQIHDKIFFDDAYLDWDVDTRVLTDVYNNKPIAIGHLSTKYKDKSHLNESYMWSGDGPRKKQPKFKQVIDG